VIGAGINGLAIAHCLRRRSPDAHIAVLERFAAPASERASSHGLIRITRSAYPTVLEVKGMFRALEEWRLFEDEVGGALIHFRPMCLFGTPHGAIADYAAAIAEVARDTPDLAVRQIDPSEARRLYPQFRFEKDSVILDDRTAGTIRASETIRRLVGRLEESGVELRYNTRVGGFERASDGYRVHTAAGDLRSRHLVVATGPWISQLVSCPPGRVTPIRQTVAYVRVEGLPTGTAIGEFPTWAHMGSGANPLHYGLPAHGGQGLKVARHVTDGPAVDLETDDLAADSTAALELVDFVRRHLVVTDVELVETERCMYTCGDTDKFIVDWLDESHQGVVVGAGTGHMFKWVPFVGRMVTDMLTDGQPSCDEARALLPVWSLK
jgi:sarcosine oxidase